MNTPMTTSAWWMPRGRGGGQLPGVGPAGGVLDAQEAVPADQHGGQAHERVQQRDQLRHPGHLHDPGPVQPDRGPDGGGPGQQRQARAGDVAVHGQGDGGGQRDRHARDAETVAGPCGLVMGQARQGADEQ
jgi:hypothetical protein